MGLGRGRTITSEWKGSNPVTPSQIRWREKDEKREKQGGIERAGMRPGRGLQKCRAIRCGGTWKVFLWSEESLVITLKECS